MKDFSMKPNKSKRSFIRHIFVMPFAVAFLLPVMVFDMCLSLFHRIIFGICGMKKVNRKSHFKVDQMKIAQLSKMQRFYAIYLLYLKGIMSFGLKIAQESEQYWCHVRPVKGRQQMMIDKSKMGLKELQAYQSSVKQKPKKSRKKK